MDRKEYVAVANLWEAFLLERVDLQFQPVFIPVLATCLQYQCPKLFEIPVEEYEDALSTMHALWIDAVNDDENEGDSEGEDDTDKKKKNKKKKKKKGMVVLGLFFEVFGVCCGTLFCALTLTSLLLYLTS